MIPLIGLGFGVLGAGFALGAWFWRVVVVPPGAAAPAPAAPAVPPPLEVERLTFTLQAVGPPVWVLALCDDGSGLWAVGRDRNEARRLALALWHRHKPDDETLTDRQWVNGLRFVEIAASEDTLRRIVLPAIEGAAGCPTPWSDDAVRAGE